MRNQILNVRIDEHLHEEINKVAEKNEISISNAARELLYEGTQSRTLEIEKSILKDNYESLEILETLIWTIQTSKQEKESINLEKLDQFIDCILNLKHEDSCPEDVKSELKKVYQNIEYIKRYNNDFDRDSIENKPRNSVNFKIILNYIFEIL